MSTIHPSPFLRNVLLLDAAASGATALLLIAGAGLLDGLLGLPVALMREAGLILVPYVAFVAWVGTRAEVSRGAVWTIIAANALWAVASIGLLVSGWVRRRRWAMPSSSPRPPSWPSSASCSTPASSGRWRRPPDASMARRGDREGAPRRRAANQGTCRASPRVTGRARARWDGGRSRASCPSWSCLSARSALLPAARRALAARVLTCSFTTGRGGLATATQRSPTSFSLSSQTSGQTRDCLAKTASSAAVLGSSLAMPSLAWRTKLFSAARLCSPQTPSASPIRQPTRLSSRCSVRGRSGLSVADGVICGIGGDGGLVLAISTLSGGSLEGAGDVLAVSVLLLAQRRHALPGHVGELAGGEAVEVALQRRRVGAVAHQSPEVGVEVGRSGRLRRACFRRAVPEP